MKPTLAQIRKAIEIAQKGGRWYWGIGPGLGRYIKYDQNHWCGTACCVWGHALLLSGRKNYANSNTLEMLNAWARQSDRHRGLAEMMHVASVEVLPILEKLLDITRDPKAVLQEALHHPYGAIQSYASIALKRIENS